jgi:hypothetical protein
MVFGSFGNPGTVRTTIRVCPLTPRGGNLPASVCGRRSPARKVAAAFRSVLGWGLPPRRTLRRNHFAITAAHFLPVPAILVAIERLGVLLKGSKISPRDCTRLATRRLFRQPPNRKPPTTRRVFEGAALHRAVHQYGIDTRIRDVTRFDAEAVRCLARVDAGEPWAPAPRGATMIVRFECVSWAALHGRGRRCDGGSHQREGPLRASYSQQQPLSMIGVGCRNQ